MGLFRKLTSLSTLGMVDFRSDKERIARYTKKSAKANRTSADEAQAQTALLRQQQELLERATRPAPATSALIAVQVPPAAYQPGTVINGQMWTGSAWLPTANGQLWTGSAWLPVSNGHAWTGTEWLPLTAL